MTERKPKPIIVRRDIKIVNELGLHARPAAQFVSHANSFHAEIWLIKDTQRFSGTSMVDILRANLDYGATVTLEAKGFDAKSAIDCLEKIVAKFADETM